MSMPIKKAIKILKSDLAIQKEFKALPEHIEALEMVIEKVEQEPCNDCISRQAAIEQSIVLRDISNPDKEWEVVTVATIKHLKSVQPEPKTGHWIKINVNYYNRYQCNQCDRLVEEKTDFCPNCGAKMVEPKESEDKKK